MAGLLQVGNLKEVCEALDPAGKGPNDNFIGTLKITKPVD
jgi:hypothetical protein